MYKLSVTLGVPIFEVERWPASVISGYAQYDELEPFGPWRDNFHSAQIASVLCQVNTPKGKKSPGVADFMYQSRKERDIDSTMETLNRLRARATVVKRGN